MKVLVFGYSDNPDRYSYLAAKLLEDYKHETIKFNPRIDDPKSVDNNFDTVTLYVSKPIADKFQDFLLGLNTKRFIFNPGTENDQLEEKLKIKGVDVVRGCTLVMLRTSQF
ncbi:MAG: CoA-binding protein [Bacteriovorax sp.]|nr:CoA-binding protein [Bacteriovorax sp.]